MGAKVWCIQIDAGRHAHRLEHVHRILAADVATGAWGERAAAQPAQGSIELFDPRMPGDQHVGQPHAAGIVHVQRQRKPREAFALGDATAKMARAPDAPAAVMESAMKRLDFVTLRLFVAIADERSLTRAAHREHLALAAVSKRISDLEAQLGLLLLYRRPRGIELTAAGDAFLHHARQMLESLARLDADMSEYSIGIRGHVRLHANTSSVIEFLPDDLGEFMDRFPRVRIDIRERVSHEIVEAVRDGLADIGLYAGHAAAAGLDVRPWRRDRLVLVVPGGHPLADRCEVALWETLDNDFIGLEQDTSLQALLQQGSQGLARPLRMRIQVRSFEGICRMIDRGMGVGILPARAVSVVRQGLSLATVALSDDWAVRELHLAMRDMATLPAIARQLVAHLMRCARRDEQRP